MMFVATATAGGHGLPVQTGRQFIVPTSESGSRSHCFRSRM